MPTPTAGQCAQISAVRAPRGPHSRKILQLHRNCLRARAVHEGSEPNAQKFGTLLRIVRKFNRQLCWSSLLEGLFCGLGTAECSRAVAALLCLRRSSSAGKECWLRFRPAGGTVRGSSRSAHRTPSLARESQSACPAIGAHRPRSSSRRKNHDGERAQTKIIAEVPIVDSPSTLSDPHDRARDARGLAYMFSGLGQRNTISTCDARQERDHDRYREGTNGGQNEFQEAPSGEKPASEEL